MNDMQNRVAVFLPNLLGGGAERVMLNLTEGFLKEGLNVDLLLAQKEGPFLNKIPEGVSLVDLHAPRVRYALFNLKKYLQARQPAGLLSSMNHANIVALLARGMARVPTRIVMTLHNTLSVRMKETSALYNAIWPRILKSAFQRADSVVAVSQGVADDVARMTGFSREKIEVIYNPVITSELFIKAAEPVEHPWFKSGEPPVVIAVGRLHKQKNYPLLIRAMAEVRQTRPARLIILGEGEDRRVLQDLIVSLGLQDWVALPGFVPNPYAYMRHSSLFVLSSLWEGLPTVLIEAMAVGVPVVATDCPSGPFEILKGGQLGELIPVDNLSALTSAILKVLEGNIRPPGEFDLKCFEKQQAVEAYRKVLTGG